ncbi:sulfatase-like hydrolase/transferase [Cognatishimia activa]|uniref:Phosphoglycerol transferase I n=1 Tax=Cognatishimia activa TaxID=1715691 RepID=A0A0P1J1G2_9RHOB|nr:sulfatase-like hydrolase/transferase [Cognatishimia activa]CUJ17681.1 phosphoglycerol transferase I [Cognatishimia activa]CUK27569.1 phosphoglycerol transferase I [Cognatishimia activa]
MTTSFFMRCAVLFPLFYLVWSYLWFLKRSTVFYPNGYLLFATFLAAHTLILSGSILVRGSNPKRVRYEVVGLLSFALLVTVPFAFMGSAFGQRDVASLLISIQENQIGQLAEIGLEGFTPLIRYYLMHIILLLAAGWVVLWLVPAGTPTILTMAVFLIGSSPGSHFVFSHFYPNPDHALIADRLDKLAPRIIAAPEEQKNLVIIYLESLERTYRDIPETKDAFAIFTELENKGLSFTEIGQVAGTEHTIGGIVASQCGVPLVAKGIYNPRRKDPIYGHALPKISQFMPKLTCLGDVLAQAGYQLSYINGSTLDLYAKGDFLRTHSFHSVRGLEDFEGWENEPRTNVWGMNDDLLFERVTDELIRMSKQDNPFVLAALTIATHGPEGYPDSTCPEPEMEPIIATAIACTGRLVTNLLEEIERLGLSDDTLVVLQSDHLSMRNSVHQSLLERESARRNFLTVLGTGENTIIEKQGSMVDVYPTLLELLGYQLKEGAAGIGQSLLSQRATFVEQSDLSTLSSALSLNSDLKKSVWGENGN